MRKKIILFLLIICFALTFIGIVYSKKIDSVVNAYANTYVSNLITKMLYETIGKYISEKGIEYLDIVEFDKDDNGNIKALTVNSGLLNVIRSETSLQFANQLDILENRDFYIPFGNIISSKMFSGLGPKVKIKIVPLGYVTSETINDFYSVGINQSLHNISINYSITINVVAPFSSASTTQTAKITIAESIIIGDVPNTNITVGSGFSETTKFIID